MFVNHQKDKTEIVEFATDVDNKDIYEFYLNNTNLLKKFMIYFNHKAKNFHCKAQAQVVKPLPQMILKSKTNHPSKVYKLNSNLDDLCLEASYPLNSLSKREVECFLFLVKGYSISEISAETSLAIPTISNYICRIKHKLKCKSRQEMIQMAYELGCIEYYFTKFH